MGGYPTALIRDSSVCRFGVIFNLKIILYFLNFFFPYLITSIFKFTIIGLMSLSLVDVFTYAKCDFSSRSAIEGDQILMGRQIIVCGKIEMVI